MSEALLDGLWMCTLGDCQCSAGVPEVVESEVLVELLTGSEFAAFVQERSDQSAN